MFVTLAAVTFGAGLLLTLGERLWPAVPGQAILRRGFVTDLGYWLVMPPVFHLASAKILQGVCILLAVALPVLPLDRPWFGTPAPWLAELPGWLQFGLGVAIYDFATYWGHRFTHGKWLWPYHAVHHASLDLDWLSTARVHPVHLLVMRWAQGSLLLACGYPAAALIPIFVFGTVSSYLLHANLPWSYGPLRYVLTSPRLHRWHHSPEPGMRDKNFALIFSFYDVIFGTYHLPDDRPAPAECGPGTPWMPQDLLGQLAVPFRQSWAAIGSLHSEELREPAPTTCSDFRGDRSVSSGTDLAGGQDDHRPKCTTPHPLWDRLEGRPDAGADRAGPRDGLPGHRHGEPAAPLP